MLPVSPERLRAITASRGFREFFPLVVLLLLVTVGWREHYDRRALSSWSFPPLTIGDKDTMPWQGAPAGEAFGGLAAAKAMAEGELGFFEKEVSSLGAPLGASWNDWAPLAEGVNAWWALLVRLFGLFPGSNAVLLSAHLLSAASFYLVCRHLRYARLFSVVGAALFAISPYSFWRGLPHLSLTFYWHLPLALLVLWWCLRGEEILGRAGRLGFAIAVAVAFGIQHVYYAIIFVQMLAGGAFLLALQRRSWRKIVPPLLLAAVVLATTALVHADTLSSRFFQGPNTALNVHEYSEAQVRALKPVELFVPGTHEIGKIEKWSEEGYYGEALFLGEPGSSYLGIVGIFSLLLLVGCAARGVARNKFESVPIHFWGVFGIIAYSIIGGATGLLALWKFFPIIPETNRSSIVILALVLLFFVRQLSWLTARWPLFATLPLAALLLIGGAKDQIPPRQEKQAKATKRMMHDDDKLVAAIEAQLGPKAMVYQLPAVSFPAVAPVEDMRPGEPFRPYLHSRDLLFSQGDNKGRPRSSWQVELSHLDPASLVAALERYGFAALLIHRNGYGDRANELLARLAAAGKGQVIARSRDFVCVALNPWRAPLSPPEFARGWHALEVVQDREWRWSSGDATLLLHNASRGEQNVRLTFYLYVLATRYVAISQGGRLLYEGMIEAGDPFRLVDLTVTLRPGANEMNFSTERPGEVLPDGSGRVLAFALVDFRLRKGIPLLARSEVKAEPQL